MRRKIAITAAALAIAMAPVAAQAKWATWSTSKNWIVRGDTDTRVCFAETEYLNGRRMSVFFGKGGAGLVISGINVVNGNLYNAQVVASNGGVGQFQAEAITNDTVMFKNIARSTIEALAYSREIYIQGLGSFKLVGSMAAITSALECVNALNSI